MVYFLARKQSLEVWYDRCLTAHLTPVSSEFTYLGQISLSGMLSIYTLHRSGFHANMPSKRKSFKGHLSFRKSCGSSQKQPPPGLLDSTTAPRCAGRINHLNIIGSLCTEIGQLALVFLQVLSRLFEDSCSISSPEAITDTAVSDSRGRETEAPLMFSGSYRVA